MVVDRPAGWRSSNAFAVFVVSFAFFTDTFLYDLIVPGLPSILKKRAGVAPDEVQAYASILLAVYGGALLVVPLLVGAFADRCSAKKIPFLVGLVVIGASTLMFFLGRSINVLIVARALQGTAAAFVWTAGPTYIMGRVGPEQMGTAMAWITMGSSVGEVTGPVAGGMLYEHSGHFALLDLAIGIVIIDIVLRFAMEDNLDASVSSEQTADECTPFLLEATPSQKEVLQNRSILIVLLSNSDFLASLWVGFMTAVIRTALEMMIPILLPSTFNWSESYSGLVILCLIGPSLLGPVIGNLTNVMGPRYPSALSFLALGPVFVALGFATENTLAAKAVFCMCVLAVGASGFIALIAHWCAISVLADNCAKEMQRGGKNVSTSGAGQVYALMNIATAAGMLFGPIWADLVAQKWGWLGMCISFGVVATISGVIEAFAWRRWTRIDI